MAKFVRAKTKPKTTVPTEIEVPTFLPGDTPEWALVMWGALRAYCNQRVVFDQDPGRFRGEYPEIALLERVAGIMEREMEDGGNPFRYVPATLRTMAKNLKKCTKPENVLASKDFVWKSPDRGVAVRILENG